MNWLTNKVLPKINLFGKKKDTPDNLWEKCPACDQMVFHRELEQSQFVCPHCSHHMRIGPTRRFEALFDDAAYEILETPDVPADPLKFKDSKRYVDKLKEARNNTGEKDSVAAAAGPMGGHETVIVAQNFAFMGGSMATASGQTVIIAAQHAIANQCPLIAICASGGMRMQEGILSLMQMPRTTIAVQQMQDAGLPFISVLTDPTTGGVTASFAMLGDITIAEPGALIGFAGPRVIEQAIREQLPEGFQRSEYLLEHGMLDMIVHRHQLRETLIRIISLIRAPTIDTHQPEADNSTDGIEAGDSSSEPTDEPIDSTSAQE